MSLSPSYNKKFFIKVVKKSQKRFMFNKLFLRNSCRLWDIVETFCWAEQATDENMAYAHCILNAKDYKHTLRIYNTYCFPLKQWLHERTLGLRYRTLYILLRRFCGEGVQKSGWSLTHGCDSTIFLSLWNKSEHYVRTNITTYSVCTLPYNYEFQVYSFFAHVYFGCLTAPISGTYTKTGSKLRLFFIFPQQQTR